MNWSGWIFAGSRRGTWELYFIRRKIIKNIEDDLDDTLTHYNKICEVCCLDYDVWMNQ